MAAVDACGQQMASASWCRLLWCSAPTLILTLTPTQPHLPGQSLQRGQCVRSATRASFPQSSPTRIHAQFIPLSLHTVPCWGSQPPFSSAAHPPTHTHPRQSVFRTRHNAATHRLLPRVKERKKGERSLIHMLRSSVKLVWGESIETSERRKRKIRY